jgi:hypothetical protein
MIDAKWRQKLSKFLLFVIFAVNYFQGVNLCRYFPWSPFWYFWRQIFLGLHSSYTPSLGNTCYNEYTINSFLTIYLNKQLLFAFWSNNKSSNTNYLLSSSKNLNKQFNFKTHRFYSFPTNFIEAKINQCLSQSQNSE